jgi:hypothetical protein
MTDMEFKIDLESFSRMELEQRLIALEFALMFNVIPPENVQMVKDYIESKTVYVIDAQQKKPFVIEGGVHQLASVIRENFPHMVQLSYDLRCSELTAFAKLHEISIDDFVGCGGLTSDRTRFHIVCFRNSSDAVLAKLYFDESQLLDKDADLEQIEKEAASRRDDSAVYSNGYASSSIIASRGAYDAVKSSAKITKKISYS